MGKFLEIMQEINVGLEPSSGDNVKYSENI